MRPNAPYARTLGGQAAITGSRHTTAAAASPARTSRLATQASSNGSRRGALLTGTAKGVGARRGGAGGGAMGAGGGANSSIGGGSGATGAHLLPHRAHLTARPGAIGPGTSYSAAQVGQVIRTARSCGTARPLATGAGS